VPEGERNLPQRLQEQVLRSAWDFYGDSLGRLKGILQGNRTQLEDLVKQLPEGYAGAQIRNMVGSYSKIEESLDRVVRDLGVEEALRQAQEEATGEYERAARGSWDTLGAETGAATGAVEQTSGQVGQIAEFAQDGVGQVLDRVGHVAEDLPGGHLLNRTTNDTGQTVQRAVDKSGVVVEIILDASCNLVNQKPVGSLVELPVEEEYQNEEGQKIRIVKEEFGSLIEMQLGEDGSILDLQIPPSSRI
jgi:hypothetical protein